MKRSGREAFYERILGDESYVQVNAFPQDEYTFMLGLVAITEDAIFVQKDEDNCLRVPKSMNPQLSDVRFGENIGVIRLQKGGGKAKDAEAVYLAFDDRRLYLEVTTARQQKALGIEVVQLSGLL